MAGEQPIIPHVVMLPYPAQGHINPMMQLAKKLASAGIQVTLLTLDYYVRRISTLNDCQLPVLIHLVGLPDGLADDIDHDMVAIGGAVQTLGGPIEECFLRLMEGPPITCIIGDLYMPKARDMANKFHIPRVAFWPQSATTFSIHYHWDLMVLSGFDPITSQVKYFGPKQPLELLDCIPGVSPIHPGYLPFETSFGINGLKWVKSWVEEQFGNLEEALTVLVNTFEGLEHNVCKTLPNSKTIGPLLPSSFFEQFIDHATIEKYGDRSGTSFWKEDDHAIQWLNIQPKCSVLYVSFGSLTKLSIEQVNEIAMGLLASKQRFLWVIRGNSIKDKPITNIMDSLPPTFLERIQEQGKVISWAPQALVLAHPSICGFLSHCGWNSTLESISMGVPILGWPQNFDQLTNCWLIVNEWKVGLQLQEDEDNNVTQFEVERAMCLLMDSQIGKDMRCNVTKLQDMAKNSLQANSTEAASHKNFQEFIQTLISLNTN